MNNILAILLFPFVILNAVLRGIYGGTKAGLKEVYGLFKERKEPDTYGNEKWATIKQLKKAGHCNGEGHYLGKLDGYRITAHREDSVILYATRGQGKSLTLVGNIRYKAHLPNKPDMIVLDPEGGLERMTREQLENNGYHIKTINLLNPDAGDVYNPFVELDHTDAVSYDRDSDVFVNLLTADNAKAFDADNHWNKAARMIIRGVLRNMPPERRTIHDMAKVIATNSKQLEAEFNRILEAAGVSPLDLASANLYLSAKDRERSSFNTTITHKVDVILRRSIHKATSFYENRAGAIKYGWKWSDIFGGDTPTIVFIRTGLLTDEGFIARLILGLAIRARAHMWNGFSEAYDTIKRADPKTKVKKLDFKRKLDIVLDEPQILGNLYLLTDAVNEQRKAGVNVFMTALSEEILYENLTNAKTLIGNCNTAVFGGFDDNKLAEDLSRRFGPKTILNAEGREEKSLLIRSDQLMSLPGHEVVIKMRDLKARFRKNHRIRVRKRFGIFGKGEKEVVF
jgi:type IV secretory pathway TraG/TraD family ATPase VirD4